MLIVWAYHSLVTLKFFEIAHLARINLDLNSKNLWFLAIAFLCFDVIILVKIIISFVIACKWKNQTIDPTIAVAKIEFYSFFTLGLFEFITVIFTLVVYFTVDRSIEQFEDS